MEINRRPHILVVDDEEIVLSIMKEALEANDFIVTALSDPGKAESTLQSVTPDVVVTDIHMPKMDGMELLNIVKRHNSHIPVIMITGYADVDNLMTSFRMGAYDYLKKPFNMNELLITVNQAVEKHYYDLQIEHHYEELELKVIEKTRELSLANSKLKENLLGAILAMVNALDASDKYTRGHSERVTAIALLIGKQLGLDYESLKILRLGAVLHDIGKIGISHMILHKPDSLSPDEYSVMKQHPLMGVQIARPIGLDAKVFDIVQQHHERLDGSGYPYGIKDAEIDFLARIVAVADTFDAMTTDRPYRKRLPKDEAVREILECSTILDNNVTNALKDIYKNIDEASLTQINLNDNELKP